MNINKIVMQLLMLLAFLVIMMVPTLAAKDLRMNNIQGEHKFVHDMRLKRFNPQPDPPGNPEKR
jgi:hypothetical protein